jgi:hypothetical protein
MQVHLVQLWPVRSGPRIEGGGGGGGVSESLRKFCVSYLYLVRKLKQICYLLFLLRSIMVFNQTEL